MPLPGFLTTTTTRSIILDAAVQLVFFRLEEKYPLRHLDNIASISSGGTPSRSELTFYAGDIPWAKISDLTAAGKWISDTEEHITQSAIEQSSAKLFPPGTVFFSMYGSIGKTCIASRSITTNQAILGLIPNSDISSEYIYYALINARTKLFSQSKGTSQKNINGRMVKEFEIPIPPTSEANKIVEFLSLIDEGQSTDLLQGLPNYLHEIKAIISRIEELALRVGEVQALRKKASEETNILSFATASKIFSHVDSRRFLLGELVDNNRKGIQTGPFGAQLGSVDFMESGHPIITIGNVQYSGLDTRKLKYVSEEKAQQLSRFFVQEGDILFARMGTVGRCCVVPKEADGWLFNYHLIRVALDKSRVEPRYIHWLIRASKEIEDYLLEKIRGATREGVNSKIVASLPCRVPPLDQQRRIVSYLDEVDEQAYEIQRLQVATQKELDSLLPSILNDAFKREAQVYG